jgi:2,3-dihydroxyphenylpropionate 1,2-dioxygenase
MSLVYTGVLSHAPGITGRAHMVENVEKRDEFYSALESQRQDIVNSGAEAIIVIAAEHFANFFMNNMPAYCIGISENYEGPIEDPKWLAIEKTQIPGAPDL